MPIEVDVWVRGSVTASTHALRTISPNAAGWTERDVRALLTEMLLALERQKNPGGEGPTVTLRGFSWIVSPYEAGGVVVHLEMQLGTASAGPFDLGAQQLTDMISRVMRDASAPAIH